MAKTASTEPCNKVFGGTSVPSGNYFISSALISDEVLKIDGEPDKPYKMLQLILKHEQNGAPGAECENTLSLNGCWRPRRGSDDKRYQASGSFFVSLLATCQGKSFDATRDYINANFANKRISVNYTEYPSQSGGFGRVPVVEFL